MKLTSLPLTLAPGVGQMLPGDVTLSPNDWHNVQVRQKNVTPLPDGDTTRSLEMLRQSIETELGTIAATWKAMEKSLSADARNIRLPTPFEPINDLAAQIDAVLRTHIEDPLDIEPLIRNFNMAIRKIYRSRQLPWGTWRTIGSQQCVTSLGALTPYARAAHTSLSRIEEVVKFTRATLDAARCAETQNKAIARRVSSVPTVPLTPAELLAKRRVVARAFTTIGQLLHRTSLIINASLTRAIAAVPRDRRYWKTKIAALAILCLLTAALGIASVMLPPLLPAVLGLGIGLKIATIFVGVLSTTHSICNVIGYPRNRGWNDLTNCITRVRNLYQTVNQRIDVRQCAEAKNETVVIGGKLKQLDDEIDTLDEMQNALEEKLCHREWPQAR
ncbi:hypothetical protein [Pandoraea anhela]|uniref:Transmembrane protein n=1 Tax=Pandoraea anhela TaxID=2508295 RepID=A0A5E4YBM0_9BURK|nr:hypothetical protein [Pandoraea anhela]VVE46094.1 hypothetical protein PAN31108_04419 [Pandoraea anhela]